MAFMSPKPSQKPRDEHMCGHVCMCMPVYMCVLVCMCEHVCVLETFFRAAQPSGAILKGVEAGPCPCQASAVPLN
jgi:hypothetical protein